MKPIFIKLVTFVKKANNRQKSVYATALVVALIGAVGFMAQMPLIGNLAILALLVLAVGIIMLGVRHLSIRLHSQTKELQGQLHRNSLTPGSTAATAYNYGAVKWYTKNGIKHPPKHLARLLVLHRIVQGRDILARQATGGRLDYEDLCALLEDFRSEEKKTQAIQVGNGFYKKSLLSLAQVVYKQDARPSDQINALALYELVVEIFGPNALKVMDFEYMISALVREKRHDEARLYLAHIKSGSPNYNLWYANIINPFTTCISENYDLWLWLLNHTYEATGTGKVSLQQGESLPFSRLQAEAEPNSVDGPLVTVIMPFYKGGPYADVSIRSILNQTWKNLELIIVDDHSPMEYQQRLDWWGQQDSRVQIIRCRKNRGAYSARNIGMSAARGELVTCQDSDDWSHPQRLEIQARHLVENKGKVANWVPWLRVDTELEIQHCRGGRTLQHNAMVSLMFWRKIILSRMGFWDTVRKAGDSEFFKRISAVFGQEVVLAWASPLLLALYDSTSLSGADLHREYFSPERLIYRNSYRRWHQEIAAGRTAGYMPLDPDSRIFPAPFSFLPNKTTRRNFDIIFVSEFGFSGGNAHSLLNEIECCLAAGLSVGMVRIHNVLFPQTALREPIDGINALLSSGDITEIALTTQISCPVVIVRWPACVQFVPDVTPAIDTHKVIIVANHAPYEGEGGRHIYEIGTVSRNAKRLFGVEPVWAPQSATIRRMLVRQLPHQAVLDIDWVGILKDAPSRPSPRTGFVSTNPVIGRHSRDHQLKWPENRDKLLKIYPADGTAQVRVLGGVDRLLEADVLKSEDIDGWKIYQFNELQPLVFLESIDFFVYYTHKNSVEAFGRVIMEAFFAGAVVVLPSSFEPVFGNAAVYAEAEDVQQTIQKLYNDWDRFLAQSERGRDYAYNNCTMNAYLQRLQANGVKVIAPDIKPGVNAVG